MIFFSYQHCSKMYFKNLLKLTWFIWFVWGFNESKADYINSRMDFIIHKISQESGVPVIILKAIAKTESETTVFLSKEKVYRGAWPWIINYQGRSHVFHNKKEAAVFAQKLLNKGIKNFDAGLMQIHWRFHGKFFKNIQHLFDPESNMRYAAYLLLKARLQSGSWEKAIALYHSKKPVHARRYIKRILRQGFKHAS